MALADIGECTHMSAFGGKADMAFASRNVCFCPKADIDSASVISVCMILMTNNRSHGTSAVPEGYLVSHAANEASKEGRALVGRRNAATATCYGCCFCGVFK